MNNSRFLKIGHRGVSGHEPENTLRSFRKAIELGVNMVELDVYVCKSTLFKKHFLNLGSWMPETERRFLLWKKFWIW